MPCAKSFLKAPQLVSPQLVVASVGADPKVEQLAHLQDRPCVLVKDEVLVAVRAGLDADGAGTVQRRGLFVRGTRSLWGVDDVDALEVAAHPPGDDGVRMVAVRMLRRACRRALSWRWWLVVTG